jgi:hypothetical protein
MKLAIQFLTSLGLALAVTFGPCLLHGYNIFGCGLDEALPATTPKRCNYK